MIVLDTDHLTIIQRQSEPAYSILQDRLRRAHDNVATTIVSVEEQMRGWLAVINRANSPKREVAAYQRLHALFNFFGNIVVLDFDEAAAEQLMHLRRKRLRLGTMDLKIAAIALIQQATLLSRNVADFQRVAGLRVEDWTQPKY
jgi:tRNA(fMet)-specific endonuclease VapC